MNQTNVKGTERRRGEQDLEINVCQSLKRCYTTTLGIMYGLERGDRERERERGSCITLWREAKKCGYTSQSKLKPSSLRATEDIKRVLSTSAPHHLPSFIHYMQYVFYRFTHTHTQYTV